MNAEIEKFKSGWIGLMLAVNGDDIDKLIDRLAALKNGEVGHFHVRRDDLSGEPSIADIEIYIEASDSPTTMQVE